MKVARAPHVKVFALLKGDAESLQYYKGAGPENVTLSGGLVAILSAVAAEAYENNLFLSRRPSSRRKMLVPR